MSPNAPAFPLGAAGIAPLRAMAESLGKQRFPAAGGAEQNTAGCREISAALLTRALGEQ